MLRYEGWGSTAVCRQLGKVGLLQVLHSVMDAAGVHQPAQMIVKSDAAAGGSTNVASARISGFPGWEHCGAASELAC